MTKRQSIGFKSCIEENKEEVPQQETKQITSADLDEIIEERMDRERDYENHMNHYNVLCENENKRQNFKQILIIVILTLLAVCCVKSFYEYAYDKGAYDQCQGKGNYVKVIDKNNIEHIIRK